jgi:hypothetical protein
MKIAHAILSAIIALSSLPGCAQIDLNPASVPSLKSGRSVQIGQESAIAVGAVMYSEYNYYSVQTAITRAPFARQILLGRMAIPAGTRLLQTTVDGQPSYCSPQRVFFSPGDARSVCLFDPGNSGVFSQAYVVDTLSSLRHDVSVPYALEEASSDSVGYKYELLYEGIAGDILKLSYREYTKNFARPAFQQDLSYTLRRPGPTEISFRGVRMTIMDADNNRVRYRLTSGFTEGVRRP